MSELARKHCDAHLEFQPSCEMCFQAQWNSKTIIDAAELARLRKNSERWEWLAEFGFYKCSGGSLSLRLNASNREELVDAVDAAIAAEKGTE